ncbi:rRNA maturation RNase YbeY [Mycoplasmopsis gallinarum]|uniref:Endoribonuclease YbeY n=1 Tax=Mycoplasmopsis gallinarum TaxID=29557 RepID=A0A168RKI6_9BACT|nr:rRNA maturation RNase YbeY [Mycoplasmopsis gallinarum]OAB49066.1 Metal-dependent hydrolase [Mycoplasmopsis gallinarum]
MIELNIEKNEAKNFNYENEFLAIVQNLKNFFKIDKTIILDVSIVNNKEIQSLNKEYRNKDYPTDILSFDFGFDNFNDELPILHLGELVISYEKVEEQAKEFGHSIKREYCYLFAHGLIHLMGYDHEIEEERIEMNRLVDEIFLPLNITRG